MEEKLEIWVWERLAAMITELESNGVEPRSVFYFCHLIIRI